MAAAPALPPAEQENIAMYLFNNVRKQTVTITASRFARQQALLRLLGQRFGDGLIYLQGGDDRGLLREAIALGLVDDEGYLTQTGYAFRRRAQH